MIRAVIFDFNGVLVDDEHVHFELFREVLGREGVSLGEETYLERYLGYDDRGCFEAALLDAGQEAPRRRVDDLIARKAERYAAVAEHGLRFFPGVRACIQALAARWAVAICSGALRPEIEFALARLNCREQITAIISAEDTSRCKPDPEGYLLALDALRATLGALADLRAGECLVVEDSLAGVASAKAAGMHAVGVTHTYPAEALTESGADTVVTALQTITPDWVKQHFA
jgi:HAD superfamily hydrolase (TIGR01509 family)